MKVGHAEMARLMTTLPKDEEFGAAVSELNIALLRSCRDAATELIEQAGVDDRLPEMTVDQRVTYLALVQLRLMAKIGYNLLGAVAEARAAKATWEQIAAVFGTTRQAAYHRWSGPVRRMTRAAQRSAADAAAPLEAIDVYDPPGKEATPSRHRQRSRIIARRDIG
ncbi:MAG: hypothetical protein HOQ36_09250 [Nocardia sp.]|nr:hypothetical protein [Nocardia sp.]